MGKNFKFIRESRADRNKKCFSADEHACRSQSWFWVSNLKYFSIFRTTFADRI